MDKHDEVVAIIAHVPAPGASGEVGHALAEAIVAAVLDGGYALERVEKPPDVPAPPLTTTPLPKSKSKPRAHK